jgi:pimeloyl-ACP methyl ester carboxylesterase
MTVDLYTRDAGEGPAVVLLHAFPLSSAMWLPQREALSANYRLITPDLRGFGGSPLGDDSPSVDVMADDVAALLDAKGIEGAVVGGLSMGGYVTMAFLRRHRDRVSAIVLADTKASADNEAARANRERIAERVVNEASTSVLLDETLPALVGETTKERRPLVLGRVKALVESAPPAAVAWAQRAMAARPDSLDDLRAADLPALVVVGEEDALSPVADAHAMVEALPNARLVTIPSAGHLSAVETPEEFTTALSDFLAGLATA